MATAGSGAGLVILFSHGGFAYEYRESLGVGPHGEALLLARKRTHDNAFEEVILKHLALPPGEPSAQTLRIRSWPRRWRTCIRARMRTASRWALSTATSPRPPSCSPGAAR